MKKALVKDLWFVSAITLLIFLFTFPDVSPDYGPGLDPSYVWGLNWLFVHDYSTLTSLIYPFGPLSFLKYPIGEGHNFILFLIFYSIVKCVFIVSGFLVSGVFSIHHSDTGERHSVVRWVVPTILLCLACYYANIDVLILFSCLFLSLLFVETEKIGLFLGATLLAVLSLFVKVSIGVNALSVVFASILVYFMEHRKWESLLVQVSMLLGLIVAMAFIVMHRPSVVANWMVGVVHLVFGYGGLSLDYDNHKFWMLVYLLSLMVSPFLCGGKKYKYAGLMLVVPVFAFWKHGMIREDMWHYFGMVFFMVVFWLVMSLIAHKRRFVVILVGAVSILSLVLNAAEMDGDKKRMRRDFYGVRNVMGPVFHYKSYMKNVNEYSAWRLQESQLPDTILQMIGDATVDIYPYEFSYAAQNKLNWQPRTALGSALSPWLEAKSAQNFSENEDAVHFVLWHFQNDTYGKHSVSLDNRYFMNDEPEVVRKMLQNYKVIASSERLLLLERMEKPEPCNPTSGELFTAQWGEWVDVPHKPKTAVRVKVCSQKSLKGKIRSSLYKDDIYTIDYQTEDGSVYTYRYDPAFSSEGLWCSPLVQQPCDTAGEPQVVKIRLMAGNEHMVQPTFDLQFEYLPLEALSGLPKVKK